MENLDESLARLINTALSGMDTSVAFLQAELPEVIVQLLMWNAVYSGVWFALGAIIVCLAFPAYKIMKNINQPENLMSREEAKAAYENNESWTRYGGNGTVTSLEYDRIMRGTTEPDVFPQYVISLGTLLIGGIVLVNNLTWLQIWIAPKVWLLEYAAKMVN